MRLNEQSQRRRALFDVLSSATEAGLIEGFGASLSAGHLPKGLKVGNAGKGDRRVILAKVAPWLESQTNPAVIGEMWAVLGLEGPLPKSSDAAVREIGKVMKDMDVGGDGSVSFELFARYINRTRSDADSALSSRPSVAGHFDGNIVHIDPYKVGDSSLVVIMQVKEIANIMEKDSAARVDPYIKLSFVCPKTEPRHGRQTKATTERGATDHLYYDPVGPLCMGPPLPVS